jgi:hypothetical protein
MAMKGTMTVVVQLVTILATIIRGAVLGGDLGNLSSTSLSQDSKSRISNSDAKRANTATDAKGASTIAAARAVPVGSSPYGNVVLLRQEQDPDGVYQDNPRRRVERQVSVCIASQN